MNNSEKICSNGCKFASVFHKMSDSTESNPRILWRCEYMGHTVQFDTIIHKVGCGTYERAIQSACSQPADQPKDECNIDKAAVDLVDTIDKTIDTIVSEAPIDIKPKLEEAIAKTEEQVQVNKPTDAADVPIQNMSGTVPVKEKPDTINDNIESEKKKRGRPSSKTT